LLKIEINVSPLAYTARMLTKCASKIYIVKCLMLNVTVAVYTFYCLTLSSVSNVTFTACVQFSAEGVYADVPNKCTKH